MLYITTQLPYPPISGGVIKSWRMIEHFSKNFDLSLFCFLKGNDEQWASQFEKRINLVEFDNQVFEIQRSTKALLTSYVRSQTLNIYRNYSNTAKVSIERMANEVDILFVDHYEMFQYVPKSFKGKVVLHEHNAEFVLWDRFAEIEKSVIKKNVLFLESKRIRKAETQYCKRADMVLAAPNDIQQLITAGVDSSKFKETYHLGEDVLLQEDLISFEQTEKAIMFLGTLNWEANVNGLLYFIENIFPHVVVNEPDTVFYIVGKNPDKRLVDIASENDKILLTGFIENVEPIYKKSRVFILPLQFGSGMKVKFLNALYRGVPTVSTKIGAEGIDVVNKQHALVAENDHEFIDGILDLLRHEDLWSKLQHEGRSLAKEKYQWPDHLNQLMTYLENL
ncbi:MAG: glycosyltransferase [Salibacteraceae bacterium]